MAFSSWRLHRPPGAGRAAAARLGAGVARTRDDRDPDTPACRGRTGGALRERRLRRRAQGRDAGRSEEHTSELQSLMRISYAVFCLKISIQQKIRRMTARTSLL